ncbi:thioredoxin family protein [Arenibacter certesii]|uniref:Thioredoxin domain-containing protein n=1 Tax=Arenibacter certesii TaxID=228955 RepID=A0A918IQ03_9FLAO|nr:thioredoxin family protein [Arenibacter certesii]GGW26072.1 hypothetical protein GCM10007383_08820 [Arenibacter certesii]
MKPYFFFIFLPLFLSAQSNNTTLGQNWHTNFEDAIGKAKKSNKDILMYFTGSDWCAPCSVLKKNVLDTDDFADIASDYVLLYIDIPRKKDRLSPEEMEQNMDLLSRYNKKGIFPFISLVSAAKQERASISGYGSKSDIDRYLQFLRKHR